MIVQLTGRIAEAGIGRFVIDVNGVGYELSTPARQFSGIKVGDQITAITTLIVREDSHTLFGFEDSASKQLFTQLHSVSGVGPKSALAVLSHWEPEVIANAIAEGQDKVFSAVTGIGPKTAKLICVTLAGKVSIAGSSGNIEIDSVVSALTSLGWNELTAAKTAKMLLAENPNLSAAQVLKAALASVSSAKLAD